MTTDTETPVFSLETLINEEGKCSMADARVIFLALYDARAYGDPRCGIVRFYDAEEGETYSIDDRWLAKTAHVLWYMNRLPQIARPHLQMHVLTLLHKLVDGARLSAMTDSEVPY